MKLLISYELPDHKKVYYSVERGDFGAISDCTAFSRARDAKMVKLGIHEEKALSLNKLKVESA